MTEWIFWVFDDTAFMPRTHCGPGWSTPVLQGFAIASGVIIATSYLVLPFFYVLMWNRWAKGGRSPHSLRTHLLLLLAFVLTCGVTHVTGDVLMFFWPAYRLDTSVKVICATISVCAVFTAAVDLLRGSDD